MEKFRDSDWDKKSFRRAIDEDEVDAYEDCIEEWIKASVQFREGIGGGEGVDYLDAERAKELLEETTIQEEDFFWQNN